MGRKTEVLKSPLETNTDISIDEGVNNQPSNATDIQTNDTMPDPNDNSILEAGSLAGAKPAWPTDPKDFIFTGPSTTPNSPRAPTNTTITNELP